MDQGDSLESVLSNWLVSYAKAECGGVAITAGETECWAKEAATSVRSSAAIVIRRLRDNALNNESVLTRPILKASRRRRPSRGSRKSSVESVDSSKVDVEVPSLPVEMPPLPTTIVPISGNQMSLSRPRLSTGRRRPTRQRWGSVPDGAGLKERATSSRPKSLPVKKSSDVSLLAAAVAARVNQLDADSSSGESNGDTASKGNPLSAAVAARYRGPKEDHSTVATSERCGNSAPCTPGETVDTADISTGACLNSAGHSKVNPLAAAVAARCKGPNKEEVAAPPSAKSGETRTNPVQTKAKAHPVRAATEPPHKPPPLAARPARSPGSESTRKKALVHNAETTPAPSSANKTKPEIKNVKSIEVLHRTPSMDGNDDDEEEDEDYDIL